MQLRSHTEPRHIVVRTYGRGGFLGLISPLLAFFMASRGLNGWQQRAARQMEDDAVRMARQGYRIASTGEYTVPLFGIVYYRVTYELTDRPGKATP